ncbi:hypothetical protein HG536_0A04070 [Torulaspora globosa]|uniref:Eisosome protein SEG1 n=1 Tax=Torulaspora globosa TaxID=48254 RepID=A0A7G3ZAQ3_9SACH|nr:uncharacterized protein HG536_0A04070 [Torulaspora globosa]QLL30589.1 hypothetical protein HG536_0A04070 [Torulaspora globosa]
MFSRRRLSRDTEQPTNASALAAASAVGKALNSNGTTVDRSKIPEYNRSPSLGSSRRSSLQLDGPLGNRNNGSSRTGSPDENIIDGIRRRTSVKSTNPRSNSSTRSRSLQGPGGSAGRKRSLRNGAEDCNVDPQTVFKEFGDQKTAAFVQQSGNEKPVTIKKYIPTSHGLVAVEVPIEEHLEQQKRRFSHLRRSSSSNSLSIARQNSLTRRATLESQAKSQERRHSSLTNSSFRSPSYRSRQSDNQPLIRTHMPEETEQELTEDIIRPLRIPRDEYVKKTTEVDSLNHNGQGSSRQLETEIQHVDDNVIMQEEQSESEITVNEKLAPAAAELSLNPPQEAGPSKARDHSEKPNIAVEKEIQIMAQSDAPAPENLGQADRTDSEPRNDSEDDLFDASDNVETEHAEDSTKPAQSGAEPPRASSLAQHLRALNPYLNQPEAASSAKTEEGDAQVSSKPDTKNLFKVPSPMKSALKKTNTQSSAASSIYSESSPANQAYLSLTTAENTRLNAKLASSENLVQRQNSKHQTRPYSVANPPNYGSTSPSPRESAKAKRHSTVQKSAGENRQFAYRPNSEQTTNHATAAARTSTSINKARKDFVKRKPFEHINNKNDMTKKENRKSKEVPDSVLYPKEPPQKRSSFEKIRNQEVHLGFKKLSLRDEKMLEADFDQNNYTNGSRSGIPTTPKKQNAALSSQEANLAFLEKSGWKSRFHDSDSDDDSMPFTGSSQTKQATSIGTHSEGPAGASKGFSLFKNKGKAQNGTTAMQQPAQPPFMEGEASLSNATPNKVNKKWSKLSLRSSSTTDAYDSKSESLNKSAAQEKRYHSNSKVEGFDHGGMKARTTGENLLAPSDGNNQAVKKKKTFGTKLKKLFGREKY